ncbi:MAG: L-ribulose-5-phosphate 4-epimerase [Phascolarctobacterium sp.]|nr:L-ribulose-5-phosphate 4-epimerase [Phascolarctobacterium sp.]
MLEELKKQVCEANLELVRRGVVLYTWGNVSGIDREKNLVVIKPSGVDYDGMQPEDMVVVDLFTGEKVEGKYKPSSDTPTHLELYRQLPEIGGVVHTHSTYAVAFAQAAMDIPALGTTHADYFYGPVPCTRSLTEDEVKEAYELNTGKVIVEEIKRRRIDSLSVPGVVVQNHGPFTWGTSPDKAVYHAVVLEEVAKMAQLTLALNPNASMPQYVLNKHYQRKHGPNAYYGQK